MAWQQEGPVVIETAPPVSFSLLILWKSGYKNDVKYLECPH